jgi:ribonucleoside-diphosphate reductase alpha chain
MLDKDADDSWELRDPHSGDVREVVSAKALWQQLLELRMSTGEPYLHFIDESNRKLPQWLKDKGLEVHQSNLCSEIILPTNEQRTAVCCLSSLNLEYFDDWKKDELFLRDIAEMLDNVLQYFIDNAPDTIARARFSASRERSIGIGALGWHALLQKKNLPWESALATGLNKQIFSHVRGKLDEANIQLGTERGEAPDAVGTGNRFSHLMAIAPNASSSIIMGNTSPSIEPFRANAYRQDTLSGSHLHKNKYLDKVIVDYVMDGNPIKPFDTDKYNEIWSSIIANDGSVQHLTWMSDWDKDVFKTAMEIDQRWVIQHAADRQEYIDQAQSLNVFFRPDSNIKYIHAVHFMAWKLKLKTMYYCRSDKIAKADKVSKRIEREVIAEIDLKSMAGDEGVCLACEG